jgi:hypothetical protein
MAKQEINIGAAANDGTGDTLRDAFDKVNDNTTELYNVNGWAYYQDAATTPATQSITTTPSKLQIDGAGANSESGYLPYEIRGSSELWDTTNDEITPIGIGDSYSLRIDFTITAESGNPNEIKLELDIGGGASPTIVIVDRYVNTGKTTPYDVSVGFPIFTLSTFNTNAGQIFLSTDTGTVTIGARGISIYRISSGQI